MIADSDAAGDVVEMGVIDEQHDVVQLARDGEQLLGVDYGDCSTFASTAVAAAWLGLHYSQH